MYQNTPILEHVSAAIEFADAALERFDEVNQNEMLAIIQRRWLEHRSMKIEELEQRLAYIKDSLAGLRGEAFAKGK